MSASAIENVIAFAEDKGGFDSECDAARAELAALNANLQHEQDRAKSLEEEALIVIAHKDKMIDMLRATVEAQARQLEQARQIQKARELILRIMPEVQK